MTLNMFRSSEIGALYSGGLLEIIRGHCTVLECGKSVVPQARIDLFGALRLPSHTH